MFRRSDARIRLSYVVGSYELLRSPHLGSCGAWLRRGFSSRSRGCSFFLSATSRVCVVRDRRLVRCSESGLSVERASSVDPLPGFFFFFSRSRRATVPFLLSRGLLSTFLLSCRALFLSYRRMVLPADARVVEPRPSTWIRDPWTDARYNHVCCGRTR